MSQPTYAPIEPSERVRPVAPTPVPVRLPTDRVAAITCATWPSGRALGHPGPDQGYALKLAHELENGLALQAGESAHDVIALVAELGMRRAARYGRAPIKADLLVGLALLGLTPGAPPEAVANRRAIAPGCGHDRDACFRAADRFRNEAFELTPRSFPAAYGRFSELLVGGAPASGSAA